MEWVETTGKTVDEAKDAALDQLGVDEQDADFEVIEEPRTGLFGRTRGEARVRARVRPTLPRPRLERRDRKTRASRGGATGARSKNNPDEALTRPSTSSRDRTSSAGASDPKPGQEEPVSQVPGRGERASSDAKLSRAGGHGSRTPNGATAAGPEREESTEMNEAELIEQGEVVKRFLLDLLGAFGLQGQVSASTAEDDAVELSVTGEDLGLLIGPKGQTLQAIQELSRSVLQRQRTGESHARIRVDVSGYRQRRREALERFVRDIAEEVRESGIQKALEPMSPPDRKVVHDTVNEIEGVSTLSEGEDNRRRVVILPG